MTQVDPKLEKFIQDNIQLMEDGKYDEVYNEASRRGGSFVSALTQILWECGVHPENEGLTEIPWGFACELDIKTFLIPQGMTSIKGYAFAECESLTNITIPNSVQRIGGGAFWRCTSLTSVTIPDGVTSIDHSAFSGCASLKSVMIPDGVIGIGMQAFEKCESLTSITLPVNVATIGDGAFYKCTSLREIVFEGTKEQWEAVDKGCGWRSCVRNFRVHCKDGEVKYK